MKNYIAICLFFFAAFSTNANTASDFYKDCSIDGFLGVVQHQPSSSKLKRMGTKVKGGAFITTVVGCSSASEYDIRPMDYLYGVNGTKTTSSRPFFCLLKDISPGESFELMFLRDGKPQSSTVVLGRRKRKNCDNNRPYIKKGFFGFNNGKTDSRPGGIIDVSSDGPAIEMGIRDSDRILRINGHPINSWGDVSTVKYLITDINNVSFDLIRDGKDMTIQGSIGENASSNSSWSINFGSDDDDNFNFFELDINEELDEINQEVQEAIQEAEFESKEALLEAESELREAAEDLYEESGSFYHFIADILNSTADGLQTKRRNNNYNIKRGESTKNYSVSIKNWDAKNAKNLTSKGIQIYDDGQLKYTNLKLGKNNQLNTFDFSIVFEEKGDANINIFSEEGINVYSYTLGNYKGEFSDNFNFLKNGTGTYYLTIKQGSKSMAKTIVVKD